VIFGTGQHVDTHPDVSELGTPLKKKETPFKQFHSQMKIIVLNYVLKKTQKKNRNVYVLVIQQ